jgi:hypothetical protein
MSDHNIKACPLKRRLKRLVFLHHQKSGSSFDDYLRYLYSSEMSFVEMVASFSNETSLGRYGAHIYTFLLCICCYLLIRVICVLEFGYVRVVC